MKAVLAQIEKAQGELYKRLLAVKESHEGLTKEQYHRFLSMQYHLTKGVQRHFYAIAAHPSLSNKPSLKKFLVNFGDEEEMHYAIAEKDLKNMGLSVLPINLDTKIWWAYFDTIVPVKPYIRLGATCILENISASASGIIKELLQRAEYINPKTSRFIVIHQHEELPHGDQIISALDKANLNQDQTNDLEQGAKEATVMYLRMIDWVLTAPAG